MPQGVAALPSPSRLALTLALTASSTGRLSRNSGYSRRSTGSSRVRSFWVRPLRFITSSTPLQRQSIPAMDRHRVTALWAPSAAAWDTWGRWPVIRPQSTEITTMATQNTVIAISVPPVHPETGAILCVHWGHYDLSFL